MTRITRMLGRMRRWLVKRTPEWQRERERADAFESRCGEQQWALSELAVVFSDCKVSRALDEFEWQCLFSVRYVDLVGDPHYRHSVVEALVCRVLKAIEEAREMEELQIRRKDVW